MRMNRYGIYISWFILCIFVVDFLLLEEKKKRKKYRKIMDINYEWIFVSIYVCLVVRVEIILEI